MSKKVSCGIIIVNEQEEVLLGLATASKDRERYDIPKGVSDDGETPEQTMLRECREEFGIDMKNCSYTDLGMFPYNRDKNLYLFMTHVAKEDIDMSKLHCTSTYKNYYTGEEALEVSAYAWKPLKEIHDYVGVAMARVLSSLYDKIQIESQYGGCRNNKVEYC